MADSPEALAELLKARFAASLDACITDVGEVTIEVPRAVMLDVMQALRDEPDFAFELLIDVCGVDYLSHGKAEWATAAATGQGFSRGVNPGTPGRLAGQDTDLSAESPSHGRRYAAVYHLLSLRNNQRVRVRVYAPDDELPVVDSVAGLWTSANWFEREAFDLYGIIFEGHPDLRRILTDYGFVGHPFRKDFPLIGNVEVRYDADKQRVVYQPVSIEPRVLVPKVIRSERRRGEAGHAAPSVPDQSQAS